MSVYAGDRPPSPELVYDWIVYHDQRPLEVLQFIQKLSDDERTKNAHSNGYVLATLVSRYIETVYALTLPRRQFSRPLGILLRRYVEAGLLERTFEGVGNKRYLRPSPLGSLLLKKAQHHPLEAAQNICSVLRPKSVRTTQSGALS